MRPLILRIVLTLTCLVAPALLGVGDRAVAGVITVGTTSECGMEQVLKVSSGASPAWDLFGRITDRFFECTISAVEDRSDDDVRLGRGLLGFLAKTLCAIGRPSTSSAGRTRSIEQENDSVGGVILPNSTSPLFAHQNHRRIHSSDIVIDDPVMRDLSQPPRG